MTWEKHGKVADESRHFFAALALCLIILLISCPADSSGWYPTGEVVIVSNFEYSNSGEKSLVVTIEVTNIGRSSISQCAVSISAATDARIYRQTSIKELVIPPGKRAYFDIEITFLSEDESLNEAGLAIDDSYYL